MTDSEFNAYAQIKKRIDELEEEIYALFEAKDKTIVPKKRFIKTRSRTKKMDFPHECTITLSLQDINILQDIRQQELSTLRKIIKEDDK